MRPGVVSIDGTRIAGNASPEVNHEFDRIARDILAEARATDEAEDAPCPLVGGNGWLASGR